MKKVLIISYYWPPGSGAGVQRWLKFSKYLRDFGWEPIIYTPHNPEYPEADSSLEADIPEGTQVLRQKIWEPYQLYKCFSGRKQSEKIQAGFLSENKEPGLSDRIATWLRGNLFIPDARKYWIKPSVRYLTGWLKENHIDAMVSTGPPHSMHMIALGLKERTGIPWLADFRDPWTQIDFYHHLMLTRWADARHKHMEAKVLCQADRVVTVSPGCAEGLKAISGRSVEVITNGYDPDDFMDVPDFDYQFFSITHLGSMNADRNPENLWAALAALIEGDPLLKEKLKIRLIGKTDISVIKNLTRLGLLRYTEQRPFLPHQEAIRQAANSAILLLALNNTPNVMGIAPGKMYEYLAMKRPILAIGPANGNAADIISETNSGYTLPFNDTETMINVLKKWINKYQKRTLCMENQHTERYTRERLCEQVADRLNHIST